MIFCSIQIKIKFSDLYYYIGWNDGDCLKKNVGSVSMIYSDYMDKRMFFYADSVTANMHLD